MGSKLGQFPPIRGTAMNLIVNGAPYPHQGAGTIVELLAEHRLAPARTAIMINGEVVRRSQWDGVLLSEGDGVELIVAAAGG
jgi:thiamine biosynthesis protein ThiS